MSWQILIGLSVILYSVSILIQRVILKEDRNHPIAYSIFFQLLCGLFIGLFGFFFSDMRLPNNLNQLILNILLTILLYGFGNVFIFKSLKDTEASIFTVIFSTRALFTVILSALLLREFINFTQIIGALLIFTGVVIVNYNSKSLKFSKGEIYALLGAIAFGIVNTNDRFLLKSFNLYPYVSLAYILPAFFVMSIYPKDAKQMRIFLNKNILRKIVVLCIIYSASSIAFFAALQAGNNASQVVTVNLTNVFVIVFLAIIFLKEKAGLTKKITGAIISFIGLVLVS